MIEIVTHCWKYPRLLMYHMSSLVKSPPFTKTQLSIFYDPQDEPVSKVLDFFEPLFEAQVSLARFPMQQDKLCRRARGRNEAAKRTKSDVLWFADVDYWFGEGCLDAIYKTVTSMRDILYYPRIVQVTNTQANGDALIDLVGQEPRLLEMDFTTFRPSVLRKAIGGVQILSGDVCREKGYLPPSAGHFRRYHRRAKIWARTIEDEVFRKYLQTDGTSIEVPNVYRIRHSKRGGMDGVVNL